MLTRGLWLAFASALLTLTVAPTADAKEAWNQAGDLLGYKFQRIWYSDGSSAAHRLQFQYLGSADLQLVDRDGARDVQTPWLGSDSFSWEDAAGHVHTINHYPYDNNHAPVKGLVYKGKTLVGKFELVHMKAKPGEVAGRWSGEMAFPGLSYELSLQVAGLYTPFGGDCTHGNHVARMDVAGFGYQDTGVLHCAKGFFADGPYYVQTLFYDDNADHTWFITLNGTVDFGGTVFQGFVTATEILGEADMLLGKFILFRPEPFGQ